MNRAVLSSIIFAVAGCAAPTETFEPAATEPSRTARPELTPVIGPSPAMVDENDDPRVVETTLTARHTTVTLGDGMTYEMMTYDGMVPGPTLHAAAGDEIVVHFTNELDEPTTIHWHGLRISDQMDGNPRIQDPVQPGETFTYRFVAPEAGTYWYHPHVRSNEQVERGLYGAIVIRDAFDPEYDAERLVVLDDILVDGESELLPPFLASHPEVMHGRYGNVLLANGRDVTEMQAAEADEGQVERWRIVNTANARTMELSVVGARWRVIGTDGGLLREPYETDRLLVPVGQRYEVEVTYDAPGRAELISHVMTRNASGLLEEIDIPVHAVDVAATGEAPREVVRLVGPERPVREADRSETIVFDAVSDPIRGVRWQLNGVADPEEPLFTFQRGETVRILLDNRSGPEHPFHLHGQFFEVVTTPPERAQPGLKDTVLVPGGTVVEILAYLDNPGRWMAHCHILEHAELGMMAEIVVEE